MSLCLFKNTKTARFDLSGQYTHKHRESCSPSFSQVQECAIYLHSWQFYNVPGDTWWHVYNPLEKSLKSEVLMI